MDGIGRILLYLKLRVFTFLLGLRLRLIKRERRVLYFDCVYVIIIMMYIYNFGGVYVKSKSNIDSENSNILKTINVCIH